MVSLVIFEYIYRSKAGSEKMTQTVVRLPFSLISLTCKIQKFKPANRRLKITSLDLVGAWFAE